MPPLNTGLDHGSSSMGHCIINLETTSHSFVSLLVPHLQALSE